MERRAQAAEAVAARSSGQEALDNVIRAVELYMSAAAQASTKTEGTRLRRKCREMIAYAEQLKSGLAPKLSAEDAILEDASRLHGNDFPKWRSEPRETEFQPSPGGGLFVDDAVFSLSPTQAETFAGWKRPKDLFGPLDKPLDEPGATYTADLESAFFRTQIESCDLVQDVTTDCSVVAGLSAAIRILIGKRSILSSIFYPFDHARGQPRYSPSGKYVMRLNFNGCSRKVVVDDRLPASLTERTLYVVDRSNDRLLWPALLEKAYLKVRGGYDFPGSNSGTDLWVLTGWIPEQVFLQREDLDIYQVWDRIKAAHDSEDVVITIGTGCISPEEEAATGLVGEHDYAVQGIRDEGGVRQLLVKNPWCNGPVWTGGWPSASEGSQLSTSTSHSFRHPENETDSCASGALWVTLEDVAQNFESMYLNWNQDLFSHRQHRHFSWEIPPPHLETTLVGNPQFSIVAPAGGLVWVLVSRHFQDAELEIVKRRTGSVAAAARRLGFMSILVFDSAGKRVQVLGKETYRGPYVDSPQTLARLDTTAGRSYTVVLDQHEFPLSKYTLTLSSFSTSPVRVEEAAEPMSHIREVLGSWNRRTSGGNAACSTYFTNPQYRLSIPEATPLSILLSTDGREVHIHVDVVWGHGKRVSTVTVKDLVTSSGEYRRGCALTDIPHIDPGEYTIVCSTFEAGQHASFGLRITSMVPVTIDTIPADAAGRLRTPFSPLTFSERVEGMRAPISANWLTRASASAYMRNRGSSQSGTLFVRLSIVHGWGPNRVTLAVSGDDEFRDPSIALRTPEFDIEPKRARAEGMWLVVEVMGQQHGVPAIEGELFTDFPIGLGAWESF